VNSASYAPGLPFAGGLATVFLKGLTGINGIIAADNYPLPTQLAGVSVKVNGELAPLLAVASLPDGGQQINFQVPFDRGLAPIVNNVAQEYPAIQIDANGVGTFTGVLPVAPGIFSFADGSPVVEHAANSTLVSKAQPVVPGETLVVYATGLGAYTPGQTGVPANGTESLVSLQPAVTLGGSSCSVLSAGPAPGYVGLDQIKCQTSKQTPKGSQPLQVINFVSPFAAAPPAFIGNSNIVDLPVQ